MEERKGYTFVGWYVDEARTLRINPSGKLPEAMHLYDKWELNQYTVEYDCRGGMNSRRNPKTVTIESGPIQLFPATRRDMVFDTWTLNGKRIKFLPEGIYENIKLVAHYKPLNRVHFEVNGGARVEDQIANNQNLLKEFRPPVKIGCEFVCWCWDKECTIPFSFDQAITKSCTLYARWNVSTYKVTYDLNGGMASRTNPRSYTYFDSKYDLVPARKKGYTFVGWRDNYGNKKNAIPKNSLGDKHFIACFKKEE
ncbi:MAG: InlB B-repeat-containing protein [Holdemanella sp.]|nr:InlB B-repeat-containing protein [Holdemanella sp.]